MTLLTAQQQNLLSLICNACKEFDALHSTVVALSERVTDLGLEGFASATYPPGTDRETELSHLASAHQVLTCFAAVNSLIETLKQPLRDASGNIIAPSHMQPIRRMIR